MFVGKKGAEFQENITSATIRPGGRMITLQAWVAASGTGKMSLVEGRMNLNIHQQILAANVTPHVQKLNLKRRWVLQQDNDPKHTSKSIMEYHARGAS